MTSKDEFTLPSGFRRYYPLPETADIRPTINYDWSLNGR